MPAKLFVWLGLIDRGHHISYLRNTKSIHTKVCTYMYICDHVCAYLIIYYPRSKVFYTFEEGTSFGIRGHFVSSLARF